MVNYYLINFLTIGVDCTILAPFLVNDTKKSSPFFSKPGTLLQQSFNKLIFVGFLMLFIKSETVDATQWDSACPATVILSYKSNAEITIISPVFYYISESEFPVGVDAPFLGTHSGFNGDLSITVVSTLNESQCISLIVDNTTYLSPQTITFSESQTRVVEFLNVNISEDSFFQINMEGGFCL